MDAPKLSVIMAVYNGLPYLPAAVDSILNQTMRAFEFIIVDDGSNDGSSTYLAGLQDDRVHLIQQSNRGLGMALNRAIEHTTSPFIARMDADDISRPNRFRLQLQFAEANRSVTFFGSHFGFTVDGKESGCAPAMPLDHAGIVSALRRGGHAICHPTLFCSTKLMQQVGGYRVARVGQDWDLLLRMSEVARGANLPDELLLYRLHSSSNAWSGAYRTIVAKRYAAHAADCRRSGATSMEPEVYIQEWEARKPLRRLWARSHAASEVLYRQAIVHRLRAESLKATLCLALASVTNPARVFLRMQRELARWSRE
jgi:glycosyltransferase involved in cell wall biosynthesis